MKSFFATVLLVCALIGFSSISALADCSECPRNANSCTVGGVEYTHCFNGKNGVYYITNDINADCNPTNPSDPADYFGYAMPDGTYSNCYNTGKPVSDCFPGPQGYSSKPNCMKGMYTISMYDSSKNLIGKVYCPQILKDQYDMWRG